MICKVGQGKNSAFFLQKQPLVKAADFWWKRIGLYARIRLVNFRGFKFSSKKNIGFDLKKLFAHSRRSMVMNARFVRFASCFAPILFQRSAISKARERSGFESSPARASQFRPAEGRNSL